ncbi:transglutaminase domain-containing protein [Flavobacterium pectinovorum]|uniref:transglutaminase domain-containing protein n=1 Tax=Flavobacterium pectinovorum TaxID=29533 RepID=UPI00265E2B4C|nr:transglutaminase domain-containing protein [Flavobacterium pectinovorum]WKL48248.1 transglutaminase domain-containing protein [Flavobacterium pectinovorum]
MTIRKIVFALLLNIVFINSSFSQKYSAIDSIVLKYPNFGSTEKLAERIQKDFTTEHDKARAIYSWIALNLIYDLKTYLDPPERKEYTSKDGSDWAKQIQVAQSNTTQKAFRSKKAVCEGFSLLYAHLASLTGLKCQVVTGDSKRLLSDIGRKRLGSNHVWNTVQIDGKWILVDATWGQGYYDDERQVAVRRFTPIYFDMDPKYFYAKHFPDSAMYADNIGNKGDFLNSPLIYDSFIKENCEVLMPFSGIIKANDGDKITFKIKNISRIDDLYYLNKKKERVKIEKPKEQNGVLEFQVTYNRKMGRFITFFLFRESLVAFKIIPE